MKFNEIVFCKDRYEDEANMWADIGYTLKMLTQNEYICLFKVDEPGLGIYVIEYNYAEKELGLPYPEWIGEDEYVAKCSDGTEVL